MSVLAGRSVKHKKGEIPNGNGKSKPAVFGMPGGFGTLDELWEVATLIQCKKMPKIPILVIGEMSNIIRYSCKQLLSMETIKDTDPNLFIHCSDEMEALEKYLEYYDISYNQVIANAIDKRREELNS